MRRSYLSTAAAGALTIAFAWHPAFAQQNNAATSAGAGGSLTIQDIDPADPFGDIDIDVAGGDAAGAAANLEEAQNAELRDRCELMISAPMEFTEDDLQFCITLLGRDNEGLTAEGLKSGAAAQDLTIAPGGEQAGDAGAADAAAGGVQGGDQGAAGADGAAAGEADAAGGAGGGGDQAGDAGAADAAAGGAQGGDQDAAGADAAGADAAGADAAGADAAAAGEADAAGGADAAAGGDVAAGAGAGGVQAGPASVTGAGVGGMVITDIDPADPFGDIELDVTGGDVVSMTANLEEAQNSELNERCELMITNPIEFSEDDLQFCITFLGRDNEGLTAEGLKEGAAARDVTTPTGADAGAAGAESANDGGDGQEQESDAPQGN